MKRVSVVFLQAVILLIGAVVLVLLVRGPMAEGRAANLDVLRVYTDPFILYGYVAAVVFFVALAKVFKLLGYIGRQDVFSLAAVRVVTAIKRCAVALAVLIVAAGVYIGIFHHKADDPAGFLAVCAVMAFAAVVAVCAAAVVEQLLRNAVDMKTENDLTI